MILIISPNSSIDYFVNVDGMLFEHTNTVASYDYKVGGKGINVSLVMKQLGDQSKLITLLGGFTGEYIKSFLTENQIDFEHIWLESTTTRINTKLFHDNVETEFNCKGPKLTNQEYDSYIKLIKRHPPKFVLLAGSSIDEDKGLYKDISKYCHENDIKFVIDSTKSNVLDSLVYNPFLIKPNLQEFNGFFGTDIKFDDYDGINSIAEKLFNLGAQNILLSLGKEGAIFINKDRFVHKRIIIDKVVNSVGAGDTFLSGFLHYFDKSSDLEKSFDFAIALSAAKVMRSDFPSDKDAQKIINNIKEVKDVR